MLSVIKRASMDVGLAVLLLQSRGFQYKSLVRYSLKEFIRIIIAHVQPLHFESLRLTCDFQFASQKPS